MDEAVADVDTAGPESETPSEPVAAEQPETPSADANATPDGGEPASGEDEDDLARFAKSRGLDLNDKAGRAELAKVLHKTLGDNSRLARELEQQRRATTQPPVPKQPEAPAEPPPDLKEIDGHITALKAKQDALPKRETALTKDGGDVYRKVIRLEALIERADEFEKEKLQLELTREQSKLDAINRALDAIEEQKQSLPLDIKRMERERLAAERHHEAEEQARQKAGEDKQRWSAAFPVTVKSLVEQTATELKIADNSDFRGLLHEEINEALMAHFSKMHHLGIEFDENEMPSLVRGLVERWNKKNDLLQRLKLQQVSPPAKQPVRPSNPTTRFAPRPAETARPPITEEELAAQRAARIARLNKSTGL